MRVSYLQIRYYFISGTQKVLDEIFYNDPPRLQ